MEKQYEIDSKEFDIESIDWSKSHTKKLHKWYLKLNNITDKQFQSDEEKVEVGWVDLCELNQLMVDSMDIIFLLNRIINKNSIQNKCSIKV